ncbi:Hypothetical protein SRAE_1000041900 [Strongyloides ratti]|uniref:MIT_C domain-containing protein n=1 Tax=Strongyloides ratti TaxID=34506 RepID=A0A090KXC1_STRRB|nr:Hypothetical protein SRAE_1000041900 [Strongyloides ratti]CEF62145.1 Hypothetical protein SRAE_1000041900 [Strongyloides ratti]
MFEEIKIIDVSVLFPESKIYSDNKEENEILTEFEIQKKRLMCTENCSRELGLRIAQGVRLNLKDIYKDSKKFNNTQKKIKKFIREEVEPLIRKLSNEEIITDIDDPRFNFYPEFSDEEDENKEEFKLIVDNSIIKKKWNNYELIEIIDIKEGQTGLTFEKIFNKSRIGANVTQILIEDPYLHSKKQNFVMLRSEQKQPQENQLYLIYKCKKKNIDFEYELEPHMHDRLILFNSGVMATPGRGLSIYHHINYYTKNIIWDNLPCKGCRIQIFRLKGFDVVKDNIYNIYI